MRRTAGLRRLFGTVNPLPIQQWIYPLFLVEGSGRLEPISSMPGQYRLSLDQLERLLQPLVAQGLGGVLLFGQTEGAKDACGSGAWDPKGVVQRAIPLLHKAFPELVVVTDVCLCAYTEHGHCGALDSHGDLANDLTAELLAKVATSHAEAGADIVAPSAMIDGQVQAIRRALDEADFEQVAIMAYSTKFASSLYGPFREAENSAPSHGDRRSYQADPANPRNAILESLLDEAEGADILMVKPAHLYLDLVAEIRRRSNLPLALYHVSGEYAMACAAAERGWLDLPQYVRESLTAMSRAGADVLITYWANRYQEIFPNV